MSSPRPALKRRRLDPSDALRKPFVSPMRAPQKSTRSPSKDKESKPDPALSTPGAAASVHDSDEVTLQSASRARCWSGRHVLAATPLRKSPSLHLGWGSATKTDTEVWTAQKAVTGLEIEIKKVQNDLDALKQARQLLHSTTDTHLDRLADKWRLVSQAVAEELFGQVKERVQRMGGVAAWREMERRKHERPFGRGDYVPPEDEVDDADCEFDSAGEELPEEEQEHRKKMKRQAKQEMMDAAEPPDEPENDGDGAQAALVWQDQGQDDDTFTIDMMLRSLNIDLAVIGYDKDAQKWLAQNDSG